jgi:hypothetical protein
MVPDSPDGSTRSVPPLGGVAVEVLRFGADRLDRALNGELREPGRDARYYVHRDGRITDGTAAPHVVARRRASRVGAGGPRDAQSTRSTTSASAWLLLSSYRFASDIS